MFVIHRADLVTWFIIVLFLSVLFAITVILVWFTVKNGRNHNLVPDIRKRNLSEIIWIVTPTLITFFMFLIGWSFYFRNGYDF